MRKFYSILNILAFCLVLYYITCKPSNENLKHATIMMGGVAMLAAGYMAYYEYTDDSEEIQQNQINKMKDSYNNKISDLMNRTKDYEEKDRSLLGMQEENRELVEELSFAKNLLRKFKSQLDDKKVDDSKEINSQFTIPSKRFGIDTSRKQPEKPNTDTNNNMYEQENYHMTHLPNQQPISQQGGSGGPPPAMNTMMENEPINLEDRLNEYKSFNPAPPPQAPQQVPEFLRSVETKPQKAF